MNFVQSMVNEQAKEPPLEDQEIQEIPTDSKSLWASHDALVNSSHVPRAANPENSELKTFVNGPLAPRTSNPIVLWETLKISFPQIFKVAEKYFSALASSVPSERMFSSTGYIADAKSNRLTSTHLARILYLKHLDKEEWMVSFFFYFYF